jgi:hypothetical protein
MIFKADFTLIKNELYNKGIKIQRIVDCWRNFSALIPLKFSKGFPEKAFIEIHEKLK